MATIPRRRLGVPLTSVNPAAASSHPAPIQRFSPFTELGSSGVAVFGGRVMTREKGRLTFGSQRWITYSDMVANVSIVAAGIRYFLNIVNSAKWTVEPADESDQAKVIAEFVDDVINDMVTPWRRIIRRGSSYRFAGFGIQEWTAKRRLDGHIGLEDIESRPQHTIDTWDVDEKGTVKGVWQVPPQTGRAVYLPRQKLVYMVEDSLTDSPEGLGLYRHMVEPVERLNKYLLLEGRGFERDLRGTPIGRVPYQALDAAVKSGKMTKEKAQMIIQAIEDFVKTQSKAEDTSLVLDSAPYAVETESGKSLSGVLQYGLELLQGQSPDFGNMHVAINRVNTEIARIIGVEHLLLGGESSGNRALSEDKSRNFYLTSNGTLDDLKDAGDKDVIIPVCDMNGIPEQLRPTLKHSDISFRSVQEITAALRDLATAGAILSPTDPAIDDVRDMLGIQKSEPMDLENVADAVAAQSGVRPSETDRAAQQSDEAHAATLEEQAARAEAFRQGMSPIAADQADANAPDDEEDKKKKKKPFPV